MKKQEKFLLGTDKIYMFITMVHHIRRIDIACKLQIRKLLHKTPNAFRNRYLVRVKYRDMPLLINPNSATYDQRQNVNTE